VTARDRIIIVVVLMAAALAGFWFVGLAPKRKEAADLRSQIDAANQQLSQAQEAASHARHAKARYNADYGQTATMGKAVPKSDALPSLLYQLQSAADNARVDFRSLKVSGGGQAPAAATPASNATNLGNAANGSSSSSTSSSPAQGSPATATQAVTSTLPPGASVGSAGFPTMPFSFVFDGSFFDMEQFLRKVQQFVRVDGDRVDVSGRLLSVDGFALSAGPRGFPDVKANISATAYLLAPGDDTATSATTPGGSASGGSAPATPTATASEVAR
jgi:hypothetical protein